MATLISKKKPKSVPMAVNLFWTSLVVGIFKTLLDFPHFRATAPATYTTVVLVGSLALLTVLFLKVSAGRNWARITVLVFFALGALPGLPLLFEEFSRSPVVGVLSMAQCCLQAYGLFLLFTKPGSNWFHGVKYG
ncbi:hypothetical protein R70006_06252 [Paraburkholderia domus]|uniref:hypothetical protein n=1 Tax=Paraburkholderia domus TaxID=2793075 RepID=UPI0019141012|nr:hypothetical protein [Paraburkholderia domus]MBK5052884.1 hypothetical protein [Burkholderia sp. R-70006]CAE6822143.1 hypothetical protein R70006_06252 [Paraburkholderia domus]